MIKVINLVYLECIQVDLSKELNWELNGCKSKDKSWKEVRETNCKW